MLGSAVEHLKTCSSLRHNRNYVAELSTANPKDLRPFTWRKARGWHFRSGLTTLSRKSVRKTAHRVFQETHHMWEIKVSQARTPELLSSMWWITRILSEIKEKLRAWLLKSNCHTDMVISNSHKYLLLLSFDSLHCISSISLKVWLFIAYINSLRESKNGFYFKKNEQKRF